MRNYKSSRGRTLLDVEQEEWADMRREETSGRRFRANRTSTAQASEYPPGAPSPLSDAFALQERDAKLPMDMEPLNRVAARWIAHGYRITYQDDYLIQLIRRERLTWRAFPYVGMALLGFIGALAIIGIAWRRRPWHVVTLVVGPQQRIITHRQRSPRPPAP